MKLNLKRTIFIGLAFFAVTAFWQMYDNVIPLILKNTFHLCDTLQGVIMAMDNVLALFLLPLFGSLSDKTHSRIGKRMPYIIIGTALASVFSIAIPLIDNSYFASPDTGKYVAFVIVLGALLFSMGIFRSPAVALMPDLTPRPLRSQGNAAKLAQKDTDARWTKKNGETHFGYKDHVKCDADSKLITSYGASAASLHDSQMCTELLDDDDEVFYADSAYSSAEIAANLPENCKNEICEKGYRGNPLTEEQKKENNRKSKICCRIEHIFGFMTNSMKGITLRCIGFKRAWTQIGLLNLVYNMCRYRFLKRASA